MTQEEQVSKMYFSFIPNIEYDKKPIQYPFSESDFVVAKNFFRRYQVNPDVFSYSVYFKKYAVEEGERLDTIAEKAYGNPFFDWIIVLTNNIINPAFAFPLSQENLRKVLEKTYDNPYSEIKHYKTYEVKNSAGTIVLKEGLIVDEKFYNSSFKYWDGSGVTQTSGSQISRPVTVFEYEEEENEKKREIFLLRPSYLDAFLTDFRKTNLYGRSSDFINNKLKKTGA
jgi:hypothetical protein